MQRFQGKVVIVTGAGSGIGEAIAKRFAAEGAQVVLAGRSPDKLERTAIGMPPGRVHLKPTDVSEEGEVEALIAFALARCGRIDVLVNDAGIASEGRIEDVATDEWRRIFATNVDGIFYASKAAMPHLKDTHGCIVNVASVSGLGGDWGMFAYDVSKGAVVNMTHALALDYAADGVRVNAVCPTFTLTPLTEDMQQDEKILAKFAERIPMGRPAKPVEIASVVAFLASPDAGFVTGVNLPVDGGLSASNGQPRM
ncbi:SDR family oxidoreductase [Verticiella sediminum]|uniref:SDR family oxidoreductase n=1 Tax=Verticiella sediminum TaxID=1247510 RepID=A0A556AIZ2_9BURK|nr:SDR family oxidoreductase [Verticiella sediminum]TSH92853.1 SDR family oxidoreductase [Verticiella sediminum]